jgi:hypothetical protein
MEIAVLYGIYKAILPAGDYGAKSFFKKLRTISFN